MIIFQTKNINEKIYTELITKQLKINLGVKYSDFMRECNIILCPLESTECFDQSKKVGDIYCLINDTRNILLLRNNFIKISYQLGHALAKRKFKNKRSVRKYNTPYDKAGTVDLSYITKVDDQFYGEKNFKTYWIKYKFIWIPIKMLFIHDLLNS